ncbi:MAG: hypothetical protein PHS37_05600, partial [Candidatus Omnitrophica bacterium]|nr:hypothetical protein [Candidatus Omnitrophota bacterium]
MARMTAVLTTLSWLVFAIGNFWTCRERHHQPQALAILILAIPFLTAGSAFVFSKQLKKISSWLSDVCTRHSDDLDGIIKNNPGLWIALIAGLGLYAELMVIRLHSSYFQLFAYFKNISLLSCFLGLGIGYTYGAKRPLYTPLVIPLLAFQVFIMHYLKAHGGIIELLNNPVTEVFMLGMGQITKHYQLITVYGFLSFIVIVTTLMFIPLGHAASYSMLKEKKLAAYGWNLIGSLGGVLAFSIISFFWAPPAVWIGLFTIGMLFIFNKSRRILTGSALFGIALISLIAVPLTPTQADIYSPYQPLALKIGPEPYPTLEVSNVYFQRILNLDDRSVSANPAMAHWRLYYDIPYYFKKEPAHVLIVGSGTGNDVASAVRNGAKHIDAVEIDPAILKLGFLIHPEQPYQKPNVTAVVNDARSYIRTTHRTYDLIVYGLLDSHSLLSAHSGVRLDSYVYTVQAFKEAAARLNDNGIMSLSFSIMTPGLGVKLYRMLTEAFDGIRPSVYKADYDGGFTFIIGKSKDNIPAVTIPGIADISRSIGSVSAGTKIPVDISTDDWPFFYMPKRTYPLSYLNMLIILMAVSALILAGSRGIKATGFSFPCFFLGAAFMLIETKGITELALAFGSTWMVISAVVAGILIMAFLANLVIIRYGTAPRRFTYPLLGISILAGFTVSFDNFSGLDTWLYRTIMTALLTLPVFFSGFAFSTELKKAPSVSTALSSNLLGAMLGGILEYNSMYFGFRA